MMKDREVRLAIGSFLAGVVWLGLLAGSAAAAPGEYETGGPLAGVKLPLYKTQHGESPGYPGCIPELAAAARQADSNSTDYTPQGMAPEVELYPGSVEHFRAYWFKYCPVRSFFDRQSLIRNFIAKDLPDVSAGQVEDYAEPVFWVPRHAEPVDTGKRNRPVPVVRCRPRAPVFRLDLGELEPGLYALRVIGAVEPAAIKPDRKPLYLRATVNDGLGGETNAYRLRLGYVEEFYSVAEVYFHAATRRSFHATLAVDDGSAVDLLVHNIDLHDVLAGTDRRALKTAASPQTLSERAAAASQPARKPRTPAAGPLTPEERLARDAMLWNSLPRLNAQLGTIYGEGGDNPPSRQPVQGADGKTVAEITNAWGAWKSVAAGSLALMTNAKLQISYSIQDFNAGRPLPDPYPFKDDGAGLYYPPAGANERPQNWFPVAQAIRDRIRDSFGFIESETTAYHRNGDRETARDAAVMLCRFAYDLPTFDPANALSSILQQPGPYGRDLRCRRRETFQQVYGNYIRYHLPIVHYDRLFEFIKDNEELAGSIGRFVPWVKTSEDVVRLLDVYLVQTIAKRALRYHYIGDGRQPARMAEIATLVGNREATDPWMEWLFSRTHFYPNPPCGIQDLMISGTDRDGRSPIGSYSYMAGEFSADGLAQDLESYLAAGGNPKFDLRDAKRFPKTSAALDFLIRSRTAGLYFPRVGDVTGPDKVYAAWFDCVLKAAERGWRWTGDPRFAFILQHYAGRVERGDEEAKAIETAAAGLRRPPWLENRSRVLPGWAGILESGLAHDDFRFRRSVLLRVGTGYGHGHLDTLDLQLHAHGLPMTVDGGQRPGYSEPGDKHSFVHNTVVVDGQNWLGHSWVRSLSDAEGARYLCAQAAPLFGTRLHRRQIALIDVDEGAGSMPLAPAQCGPDPADLPTNAITPNSYVFDCVRVAGGRQHIYCFHGPVNDPVPEAPKPRTNAEKIRPLAVNEPGEKLTNASYDPESAGAASVARPAVAFIGMLRGEKYEGTAPAVFEALFQIQKERFMPTKIPGAGTEKFLMRQGFDPQAPDKFLKLRLLGMEGNRVLKGDHYCRNWEYSIPNIYVERAGASLESVFPAVIEPYAGRPFIRAARNLAIPENEADALKAVAVEVEIEADEKVGRSSRTDICFADGRPDKVRAWQAASGKGRAAGEFAYVSTDAQGIRQATLTGGTLLEAPGIKIEAAVRAYTGTVVKVDYLEKTAWVDAVWPDLNAAGTGDRLVEIGTPPESGQEGYVTGYALSKAQRAGRQTALTFTHGADYFRAPIKSLDPQSGILVCSLGAPGNSGDMTGINRRLVASDDAMTKFWRADVLPWDAAAANYPFRLSGAPVAENDFAPSAALRLWEYGPGDVVRHSTAVSIRRTAPGVYSVEGDVDVTVTLNGKAVRVTTGDFLKNGGVVVLRTP